MLQDGTLKAAEQMNICGEEKLVLNTKVVINICVLHFALRGIHLDCHLPCGGDI